MKTTSDTQHWSDRAREGVREVAHFLADNGLGLMATNCGLWGAMTATAAVMAATSENPFVIEHMHAMAVSLGATGIFVSGGIGLATTMAAQMANKLDFRDRQSAIQEFDSLRAAIQTQPSQHEALKAIGSLDEFVQSSPAARGFLRQSVGDQSLSEMETQTGQRLSAKRNPDAEDTIAGPSVS